MRIALLGGGSGMGLALCRHYLGCGATVAVFDLVAAEALADEGKHATGGKGGVLHNLQVDFNQAGALQQALQQFDAEAAAELYVCFGHGYFSTPQADSEAAPSSPSPYTQLLHYLLQRPKHTGAACQVVLILPLACRHDSGTAYARSSRQLYLLATRQQALLAANGISQTLLLHGYVNTPALQHLLAESQLRCAPLAISPQQFAARAARAIAAKARLRCLQPALAVLICCDNFLLKLKKSLHALSHLLHAQK